MSDLSLRRDQVNRALVRPVHRCRPCPSSRVSVTPPGTGCRQWAGVADCCGERASRLLHRHHGRAMGADRACDHGVEGGASLGQRPHRALRDARDRRRRALPESLRLPVEPASGGLSARLGREVLLLPVARRGPGPGDHRGRHRTGHRGGGARRERARQPDRHRAAHAGRRAHRHGEQGTGGPGVQERRGRARRGARHRRRDRRAQPPPCLLGTTANPVARRADARHADAATAPGARLRGEPSLV